MKILVTGGAGYIGSFMTNALLDKGYEVVVVDSLERGNEQAINSKAAFLKGNLLDKEFASSIFKNNHYDGIIHFAGYISVAESMENPNAYFQNNVYGSLNLIEEIVNCGCNNLIFSSTAAVYGNPTKIPIPEDHLKNPTSPYGESKLMVEKIMEWFNRTKGLNYAALRYFNASGAALDGAFGEDHHPESHIIPKAMEAAIENKEFMLFGEDYSTEDGSCVRDYIHVLDLVGSHILALERLQNNKESFVYNVGTGKGHSSKEIIKMVKKASGVDFPVTISGRRPGDSDVLIADPLKINSELNFVPKYSNLETIIETAWKWHSRKSK